MVIEISELAAGDPPPVVLKRCTLVMRQDDSAALGLADQRRRAPWMKLHQLRYLVAVVQNGLNITAAALKLHTSQPGVSKQIKLLEEELGFLLFVREGRTL